VAEGRELVWTLYNCQKSRIVVQFPCKPSGKLSLTEGWSMRTKHFERGDIMVAAQ
jgi:hypothetical protein